MSAASTSLDDDGGSTTSSEGGGYLGITGGKSLTPNHPHLGGKTMVGGKTIKSMGNSTDDDSDLDDEENQNEEISYEAEVEEEEAENDDDEEEEGQSFEIDDEETEDEDDTFQQQPKVPPPTIPKIDIQPLRRFEPQAIQGADDSQQSQLEAWKEVHASLTKAVLVAREAIASKKLQRRFWLETICANLSHPDEVKTTGMSASPSQMPLLLSHSVWFKPDQRKKKRGSKKREQEAEDTPKAAKKARKPTKATAINNKTTLASLSGTTKKKVAKGSSLFKKRKIAMLPLKGKGKAAAMLGKPTAKKKRATAALPTKKTAGLAASTTKPKIRLNINSSKTIPPEAKAAAPAVLSVFADSDDESDTSNGEDLTMGMAYAKPAKEDEESDGDAEQKPVFSFNADDDTSSEEENGEDVVEAEIEDSGGDNTETGQDDGPHETNKSDNYGHDWNASSSHPFLKKRRSSIQNVGSSQGNLDSSEIYSTFRPGPDNEREETKNEAKAEAGAATSRMMVGGYGTFGGSDSSEDEIPF